MESLRQAHAPMVATIIAEHDFIVTLYEANVFYSILPYLKNI